MCAHSSFNNSYFWYQQLELLISTIPVPDIRNSFADITYLGRTVNSGCHTRQPGVVVCVHKHCYIWWIKSCFVYNSNFRFRGVPNLSCSHWHKRLTVLLIFFCIVFIPHYRCQSVFGLKTLTSLLHLTNTTLLILFVSDFSVTMLLPVVGVLSQ